MKFLRLTSLFLFAIFPMVAHALVFDPPLNEGIEFPETQVEETSTVEMTVTNNANFVETVRFEAPRNEVFEIEPLQVRIQGQQEVVIEFHFTPNEAGEVEERVQGTYSEGMAILRFSMMIRGVGVEGDPVITVEPDSLVLELEEPAAHDEASITVGNEGEARLRFQILGVDDIDWLDIEPLEGEVQPEEELELNLSTTENIPARGLHWAEFVISSNDPEREEISIAVALNVDFFIELELDREEINVALEPDTRVNVQFEASNGGDARLLYRVERRLVGDVDVDPWDIRVERNIEDVLDDTQLNGVVCVDGRFYVSGGNNGEDVNKIYILDLEGNYIDEFDQEHESRSGLRDLTWDGELIWGADGDILYGFRPDGEQVATIEGEAGNYRSLTWDPDREVFWSAGIATDIFATDAEGNVVAEVEIPDGLRLYGLAYWADDPDGFNLYVFARGEEVDIAVYKVNLEDGEWILMREFDFDDGRPAGISITNQFDTFNWVFVGIVQNPDHLAVWQLDGRRDWFRIDPVEGTIEAESSEEFTLTLDAAGLPLALFEGELVFTVVGGGGQAVLPVSLRVAEGRIHTTRTLNLHPGWNTVSTNLQPDDEENIEGMLADLVDEGLLEMMKNGAGNFYRPDFDFNNIPGWYVDQGYQIKMRGAGSLRLEGESVLANDPIRLGEGWNLVSYFPRRPIDATIALSDIADHLVIAKDGYGNFYLPAWDFSNMGEMQGGQGYHLNMDREFELVYVDEVNEDAGMMAPVHQSIYENPGQLPVHPVTSLNMSLLIAGESSITGEIAVYSSGRLVGSGVIQDGLCGIAVWGDDPTTDVIDGALPADSFDLKILNDGGLQDFSYFLLSGDPVYTTDALTIIQIDATAELPEKFGIMAAYPNPFNSKLQIRYALPVSGRLQLSIYDLSGRLVSELVNKTSPAGTFSTAFNATGYASGIYMIRYQSGNQRAQLKAILLK